MEVTDSSPSEAPVMLHLNVTDNSDVTSWEDSNKLGITVTKSISFIDIS
jgi:hypothetical protein